MTRCTKTVRRGGYNTWEKDCSGAYCYSIRHPTNLISQDLFSNVRSYAGLHMDYRRRDKAAGGRYCRASVLDLYSRSGASDDNMDVHNVKESIEGLRIDLVHLINSRIGVIVDGQTQTSNGTDGQNHSTKSALIRRRTLEHSQLVLNGGCDNEDDLRSRPKNDLQIKQFIRRDSLLTDLFQSSHIRTIYHIFVAILIILIISSMMHDLVDTGTLNLKFEVMRWCFGGLPIVITIWIMMFLSTILILYPLFQHWAYRPGPLSWWDYCYLLCYLSYIGVMIVLPIKYTLIYELPVASAMIVACEQVRLIMKSHAFVRENAAIALRYKNAIATAKSTYKNEDKDKALDDDTDKAPCPDFGKFLYFLFAPTLIYRNEYPRTAKVDWGYVVTNFMQVLGCLFYVYYVFSHFCIPIFQGFNKDHIAARTFILAVFSSVLPGTLCLFLGFFAVLHSWLNAFAEMLRFGDRLFYRDWWNATSLAGYYRTWNLVVHDWLYTYVYRDVGILCGRTGAVVAVFFISALVHEYIVTIAFRFFYPVLFIEFFGIGVWFMFMSESKMKQRCWNILLWVSLFMGTGLLMCLYSMEWYARINCPRAFDNFLYYLTPQSWICQATSDDVVKTVLNLK